VQVEKVDDILLWPIRVRPTEKRRDVLGVAAPLLVGLGELLLTALDQLGNRDLAPFDVSGTRIAIANVDGAFYAFGTPARIRVLARRGGPRSDDVTCACHGSQFNVTTGDVVRGPAREPVRSYPVRLEGGTVRVEV
jgi:nitrite reductase/ring-hydroxylating ferredoxin subunit